MSATRLKTVKSINNSQDIEMQEASIDIWDKKYRLKDKQDKPVDQDIEATYLRVAKALSEVESKIQTQAMARKVSMGPASMVRYPLGELSLMPALKPTNQPRQLLTAPYQALFQIPWLAFWSAILKRV